MTTPAAIYLQDAHPIREGMEFAKYAEAKGFDAVWQADSRLVRDAVVPMAAFAAVTEHDQDRLGRRRLLDPQPGPPGRDVLDARRPRARPRDPRHRRVVGSAGRARSASTATRPLTVMREVVTVVRALLHNETVTLRRRVRAPRRRRARLRVPGASPEGRADLHRRHGHADDGAHRRDRRRRGAQLPRVARLQPAGDRGACRSALDRPGARSTDIDRPQLVVCSVHEDRQTALDMARLMVTQYLGQQPHIMKASGVPQSLLDEVGEVLTWPATHEQVVAAIEAGARRDRADAHRLRHAGRGPRPRSPQYIAHGCTCPILYPLGDVHAMIDAFAGWTATT